MKRFYSIKSKLLLLLSATILLIMLLVGLALGYLIERYYQEDADKGFARGYSELAERLRERESMLQAQTEHLSHNDEVIAAVNMIARYARPEDYQALAFDSEKAQLSHLFGYHTNNSGIDEIAAYTVSGDLISYYSVLHDRMGYLTYKKGLAQGMAASQLQAGTWLPGELPVTMAAYYPEDFFATKTIRYRQIAEMGVVSESIAQVLRTYPDGKKLHVGYIIARKYLTDGFIRDVSRKTGIELNMLLESGEQLGDLEGLSPEQFTDLKAVASISEHPPYARRIIGDFFTANLVLEMSDGGRAIFVSAVTREEVSQAIEKARTLMLLVLFLAAAIIFPIGIALSNRTISRPLALLSRGVEEIGQGRYGETVAVEGDDELAALGNAFNEMSVSICQREAELVESEAKYRTLVDNLPQRIFLKDRNSVFLSCNRRFAADVGLEPADIVGKTDLDLYPHAFAEKYRKDDQRIMHNGVMEELEESYQDGDRETIIQTVKSPVRNSEGEVLGILGIFWDISDRKQAEQKLRQSAVVFESTAEGVIVTDAQNRIIAVNKAFSEITGYSEEEALQQNPSFRHSERQDMEFYESMWQSILSKGRWQGEIWNRRKSGDVYPEWMTLSTVEDENGATRNYVAVFSDITNVKRSQMQLDHMAHHDPLTDLPNRNLLADRLEQAIRRAERRGSLVAVLFIDLDRFKNVNDTLGHALGDELLQQVAQRLQLLLRQQDTIARLGGDEFVILIEELERPAVAEMIAAKVIDVLSSPFTIQSHELYLGASIGISLFPNDAADFSTLIKYADSAMYSAKEQGRNTYRFYTQELTDSAMERLAMESALRHALERGQFTLHYQPQINISDGRLIGAEALLRWNHPKLGMVPPDKFIPLAEECGLILSIGDWVLEQACRQTAQWQKEYPDFETIAINLSAVQIQQGDIVNRVAAVLDDSGLPAAALELEITESVLIQFPELAEVTLTGLREQGVVLAIDDFGTGYSSLTYLKRFPIQILKIDRSFIQDIPHDSNDTAITRAVIALGRSLQLKVIAEGIESAEQAAFLQAEGCEVGQGYYFSRPLPAQELLRLLKTAKGGKPTPATV